MSVARLTVRITDVNDKAPQFQGVDVNGQYPAAVSDYTRHGDEVIFVSAIDLDTTAPNNDVSVNYTDSNCISICLSLFAIHNLL